MKRLLYVCPIAALALLVGVGCGSSDAASEPDAVNTGSQFSTRRDEDGLIVQMFDASGNGQADIVKFFEESPDPSNPAVTRRMLRKVEIDVNGAGRVNIRRVYNDQGDLFREELDVDLDGRFDTINTYSGGALAKKELLGDDGVSVVTTRYYQRGTITRVESDTNGDGQIDLWEYYEEGVLTRVGRDLDGDGRVDRWTQR